MKLPFIKKCFVLAGVATVLFACNNPDDIGKGLLDGSLANTKSTNALGFAFTDGKIDSVLVYEAYDENRLRSTNQISVFVAGDIDDPVFGKTSSEIYTQFRTDPRPDIDVSADLGFSVDSAYMVLYYDTLGFYGDTSAPVDIKVHSLNEAPDVRANYYTSSQLPYMPVPIGQRTKLIPSLKDSFFIYFKNRFGEPDTFKVRGAVKIPLTDPVFLNRFLLDTTAFFQPKELPAFLPGFHIQVESSGKRMIGLDLNSSRSFIEVFYHSPDTTLDLRYYFDERLEYENPLVKIVHQSHNYAGTPVETFLNASNGQKHAFLQGLSGIRSHVQLNALPKPLQGDVSVNLAEIHLPVEFLPGDDSLLFPPPRTIVTALRTDKAEYTLTREAKFAWEEFLRNRDYLYLEQRYGGTLKTAENGSKYYDINITTFVQDYILGRNDGSFYISLVGSQNNPKRVVFCSPNSSECSAGLKVIYTEY